MYLKAVMTFEEKHIEEASAILGRACDTIGKLENIFFLFGCSQKIYFLWFVGSFRKKSTGLVDSLGSILRKPDYDAYTDMEVHAELCFAEVLLLKVIYSFINYQLLIIVINLI